MIANTERLNTALDGRYKIEKQLGQGGMATVYLAKDIKHDRMVAVKVLKPELAAVLGAERFVVEIKTTAALQHPHILPLFDSGTADGFLYYVMPYIEGETLRGKLNRETQFSVEEAVRITTQVADALDYAHRHGVIHRDIKPENILLHDGRPMVADFGIALAVSAAAGGRMTETGLSLGTPHYMSPEQATAEKEITGRSDIYSLASVLYEMLTGNPPHMGSSAQQIIMKIITEQAPLVTNLRKAVPPNVAAALAQALEKLPADRFESAKAFAEALANRTFTSATLPGSPVTSHQSPVTGWPFIAVSATALIATAVAAWSLTRPATGVVLTARFIITAAPALPLNPHTTNTDLAISPDGRRVAYVAGTNRALYVRSVDSLSGTLLVGTDGAMAPVFSPDGKWIAFSGSGGSGALGTSSGVGIRKVPSEGGPVTPLADVVAIRGLSWGANDTIVASTFVNLVAIPAQGGAATSLTSSDSTNPQFAWRQFPEWLPGGSIIYSGLGADGSFRLAVLDRKDGTERMLPQVGSSPRWASTGHIIYQSGNALWAVRFDPVRLQPTGSAVLVQQGVAAKPTGAANFAIAREAGTLVYATGRPASFSLMWIDTSGRQTPMEGVSPGVYRDPRFSPDGRMLALSTGSHLFTYDIRRATLSQVSRDSIDNYTPVWTPDNQSIVFTSTRGGVRQLYEHSADGSGSTRLVVKGRPELVDFRPARFTRDGSLLLVTRVPQSLQCWIGLVKISDPGASDTAIVARNTECNDFPALSPDGRWVAYNAGAVAMVERFPEGGMRQQLSVGEGRFPLWSRDGRSAYYQVGDSMMAVSIQTAGALNVGRPRFLFRADFVRLGAGRHNADLGPDGRFVVVVYRTPLEGRDADASGMLPGSVVLVQDWTSELKRIMAKK